MNEPSRYTEIDKKHHRKRGLSSQFRRDVGALHLLRERQRRAAARLHAVARVHPEEKCQENHRDAEPAHEGNGVAVQETREEDGDGLPQGHDDGEDGGAELADGVEDEELAARGAHGQQHGV